MTNDLVVRTRRGLGFLLPGLQASGDAFTK